MLRRSSGILLHITSLANDYGIGDLGPSAYAFVDFLHQNKQHEWQMLPITPLGIGHSPYNGTSAFAGNPLLISLDLLCDQGFLTRADLDAFRHTEGEKVDYTRVEREKNHALSQAFRHVQDQNIPAFDHFIQQEAFWLDDFALFLALQAQEGTKDWTKWGHALRTRQTDALEEAKVKLARDMRYHQFVQWQFAQQWQQLASYCQQKNVRLIGDVPLFVAHHSADVWANPTLFKLNEAGQPYVMAGAPPDDFNVHGQLWHVPVYCWTTLREQNYAWWVARLRHMLTQFDLLRLDHFIGFIHTYEVAADALTASDGEYTPGGGIDFFDALRKELGALPFILEDLGLKTPEVDQLREDLQLPGMRVLPFEFEARASYEYPESLILYTGTHDNDTLWGWYQKLSPLQREKIDLDVDRQGGDFISCVLHMLFMSQAFIVIIPLQDLLKLSSEARMNTPGTPDDNWQWRMSKDALHMIDVTQLRRLTEMSSRDEWCTSHEILENALNTLAIDIGGTKIKMMVLDTHGQPLTPYISDFTPHPATCADVCRVIQGLVATVHLPFDRISVGFPGVIRNGVIKTAANMDPSWLNIDFQQTLHHLFAKPVRMANDADLQGYGDIQGHGVEMVITLGTGMGSALFTEGKLLPNLELGHHIFYDDLTYEQCLGHVAMEKRGMQVWQKDLQRAIAQWARVFNYDQLYIGGGYAHLIDFILPEHVHITNNVEGILGGIALWRAY